MDVEEYEIVATLDSHTSSICQEQDGKVYKMNDYQPGVTAPPFHNYCRSTTVPHFNDDYDIKDTRAARDEKGNTYYVENDVKYKEWYDIYENEISMTSMKDINTFYHEWMHSIDYMTAYKKDYTTLGKDFKWISENLQEVRIATANKINNTIPQSLVDIMNSQRNRIKNQLEESMIKSGKLDSHE